MTPARWHAAALMWSQSQPLGLGKPMIGCDTVPWALLYWPQHCIWGAPKQKGGALSPGLSEPQRWDGDPRLQAGPQGGAGVPLELCVGDSACSSAPPGAPRWCVLPFQFQWLAFPLKDVLALWLSAGTRGPRAQAGVTGCHRSMCRASPRLPMCRLVLHAWHHMLLQGRERHCVTLGPP